MEEKTIKAQVFTTETVFSESAEQPIDIDFSLPDYCPDISKILKCRAVSRISSKGINGRNITVDGTATVTVIYSDPENRVYAYEYQYPFSKSFESGSETGGTCLNAKTKCEYINCRAVTGRKIDIHGAVGIYITLTKRKCVEVVSDSSDNNIELLRGSIPATVPMGCAEKYLVIEEEIELGSGQPDIGALLRYDGAVCVRESKLLAGKAVVKGELAVTLLYSSENYSAQTIRSTIPFSQLLEIEGASDNCECKTDAEIAYLEIKPRTGASGEVRSFSLNAKLLVSCETLCNDDIEVVLDAYSRKFESEITRNEVTFNKIVYGINESFSTGKNLEFSNESVAAVYDMWCEVRSESCRFENNSLIINGTVTVNLIAADADGVPSFYERAIEFSHQNDIGMSGDELRAKFRLSVISCGYTLTSSGNIDVRADVCVNARVYECNHASLITDITVDCKHPIEHAGTGAMTIYFASMGESVWDIARRYCADINEVKHINDITDDILQNDRMILVPIM